MSESKEDNPQVSDKVQKVLDRLEPDYKQGATTSDEELRKNIAHHLIVLGRAELWASGLGGNEQEANELMREGLRKVGGFYDKDQLDVLDSVLSSEVAKRGEDSLFAKLITENRGVLDGLKEEKK